MVEFDNDIRESQMIEMLTTEYTKILADGSDDKTQMTDFEKPVFSSVLYNFKFRNYCQESNKENSNFLIHGNIRVTVSLDGTFTYMQKPLHLQAHFDEKGKPLKFRFTNFCLSLIICP